MVLEKLKEKKQAGFKKRAVRAGIGIGAIANVCYLYANHARRGIRGGMSPPDPVQEPVGLRSESTARTENRSIFPEIFDK